MKKLSEKGFGVIEIVAIIFVILAISGTGWYAWHTYQTADGQQNLSGSAVTSSSSLKPKSIKAASVPKGKRFSEKYTVLNQPYLVKVFACRITASPKRGVKMKARFGPSGTSAIAGFTNRRGIVDVFSNAILSTNNHQVIFKFRYPRYNKNPYVVFTGSWRIPRSGYHSHSVRWSFQDLDKCTSNWRNVDTGVGSNTGGAVN